MSGMTRKIIRCGGVFLVLAGVPVIPASMAAPPPTSPIQTILVLNCLTYLGGQPVLSVEAYNGTYTQGGAVIGAPSAVFGNGNYASSSFSLPYNSVATLTCLGDIGCQITYGFGIRPPPPTSGPNVLWITQGGGSFGTLSGVNQISGAGGRYSLIFDPNGDPVNPTRLVLGPSGDSCGG